MKFAIFTVLLAFVFSGCTKKAPVGPDGKPLVDGSVEPEKVLVETQLSLPEKLAGKVKKTDLLIWSLTDKEGELLAAKVGAVPTFPAKVQVKAADLRKAIPHTSNLLFSARIVKVGEEDQPPKKGQLQVTIGDLGGSEPEVTPPGVDPKVLEAYMKKMHIVPAQKISVGDKVTGEFGAVN